jgi:bis(5'-nucleosidyl)-tetraphosphatase
MFPTMPSNRTPFTERSAGVLLYRLSGDPPEPDFLLLDYGRHWDFPKGHLEEGEDDLTAARRELAEETGILDVAFHDGFRFEMTYTLRDKRKHGLIRKTVVFFLGRTGVEHVTLSHEHVGCEFLPFDRAIERVTYENAKDALRAARAFLNEHGFVR